MATDMLTVPVLNDLRLASLKTSVDDWRTMVGRLEKLATGGDGQVSAKDLQKKANAADWVGVNATVSRQFVARTAAQFDDAASEAKSVLAILSDAHAAFTQHKQDLQTAIDELAKRNIYVSGKGGVIASVPPPAVAGKADIHRPTDQELEVAQARITRILWEATETDRIAARALRLLAKDKYDFTDQGSTGLEDADHDQGRADAAYWRREIAKGNVENWSEEKLARFNETLKNQRDNPGFTETLALDLGADGTLQFWRDLADPGQGKTPDGDRAKLLGDLQKNLSMSLAGASHSTSPEMEAWKKDLIAAGGKLYGHEGIMAKTYGFQIMSNLMVKGKFDEGFLDDYYKGLRTFEAEKKPFDPASVWGNPALGGAQLDYTAKGPDGDYGTTGSDPMAGFLKAVSHNPDYATELFSREDAADYLLTEREYYDEDDPYGEGDGTVQSRDALGKALLAAGTGLNPDQPYVVASYEHTEVQRQVFDGAMRRLADKGDEFPAELRDDTALLLGNWGDDVHRTASSLGPGEGPLDYGDLLEVSKQVSRDQNAYGTLMEGVNQAVVADFHTEHQGDPKEELIRAGHTVGFMESVRYQALETDKEDPSWSAKWGYHIVGGTANFIPVVGDAVQRGVDSAAYAWQLEEQGRIDEELAIDTRRTFASRSAYLDALGDEWSRVNPGHELSQEGNKRLRQGEIGGSAFDGNDTANRAAGITPR
ncbi:hypothetical protein HTV45_21870 [Streptomyces sp. CHD11]|uniref:hypothetical protein n=1 Tax=Streptomyces sp. CHD11 TaxID=2741325 RepID=UPI001BFBFBBF|nr:hypothetical protein [Streptomyces sp. CHD11]MBT3153481.1 hypothetical protein [Streptomyces sp. CHD11]